MRSHLASFCLGILGAALLALSAHAATTFRVAVPANTPAGSTVYIAGSFQAWNPGSAAHALVLQPDGRWAITLDLAAGVPIQYKFTRGTWAKVEKGANGEEIANRTHTPSGDQTLELTVASWADVGTVTGRIDTLTWLPFLAGRRCWIYVPPGYDTTTERYPVLYMHDGQNLFDASTSFAGEWHIDEACQALIASGEIEPLLVVGIENSAARCFEYTPWAGGPCTGGGGDAYLQAIRDELMPEVNRRYRTRTGPDNTFMAGSSLGGLITHYAGHAYAGVWGRIAAFSSSLWWANDMMATWAATQPRPNLKRYYQDMGTREGGGLTDADGDGIDDYIEDLRAMRDLALGQGFVEGVDFLSVEGENHTHSEYWWAQRAPDMLRFLVDPAPGVSVGPGPRAAFLDFLPPSPNPTASSSRFVFVLASPARARVSIVDVTGRQVAGLAAGTFAAGRHTVSWGGRTDGGDLVPAGIYWARLESEGRVLRRKLTVVR